MAETEIIKLKKHIYNLNEQIADYKEELGDKTKRIGQLEEVHFLPLTTIRLIIK